MQTEHTIAIFYITNNGLALARSLREKLSDADIFRYSADVLRNKWDSSKNIICIMATGIVVRVIAPLLKDKRSDPAVVVIDEKGEYVISLLSGHLGGANALTREIADCIGSQAVITTSSDVQGKIALDLWASEENLYVEDYNRLKTLSAKIVNGKNVKVQTDCNFMSGHIPDEFNLVDRNDNPEIIITCRLLNSDALFLRPGNLFAGIGCNRGTSKEEIKNTLWQLFEEHKFSIHSIARLATIDLKNDEQGLIDFADDEGLEIDFFSNTDLNDAVTKHDITPSDVVRAATGAAAVAEPAAILAAQKRFHNSTVVIPKEKRGNVTLSIVMAESVL